MPLFVWTTINITVGGLLASAIALTIETKRIKVNIARSRVSPLAANYREANSLLTLSPSNTGSSGIGIEIGKFYKKYPAATGTRSIFNTQGDMQRSSQ